MHRSVTAVAVRMADEIELAGLGFWPNDALDRLRASWITTAEQILAIAATTDGLVALTRQTGLGSGELVKLVEHTRQMVAPELRERLSKPADTSKFGTGAVDPSKMKG